MDAPDNLDVFTGKRIKTAILHQGSGGQKSKLVVESSGVRLESTVCVVPEE